jgi:HSP20 family molecular chaperone IbpA
VQFGTFMRSFLLPTPVVVERVSARLDDGVLTIRVTDNERGEPSQIPIRS